MKVLFEYPFVIISVFVICIIILGFIGIIFAIKGAKTAKMSVVSDFSSISKLETLYVKRHKNKEKFHITYIDIDLDNIRQIYSDTVAKHIMADFKPILLDVFSGDETGLVAVCDTKNFVAINFWNEVEAKRKIADCLTEFNKKLLKHRALNIVKIHFGGYCPSASDVMFQEAVSRAKKASAIAENEETFYAKWNSRDGKEIDQKINIENRIENHIDNNSFFLEYQPIISAKTMKIVGAEVFARLKGENGKILSPGSFLGAVSSVGVTGKFDYYIFEKNCKWISHDKEVREKYRYAINISRSTFCDEDFVDNVLNIVEKYGIRPQTLALEVLEDEKITRDERAKLAENIKILKDKGFYTMLDDFGSGYTTFDDLNSFAVDVVKLDRSILTSANSEKGIVILNNLVKTANELGFKTVCEGIETKEQEKAAIDAGCSLLQGFMYYRPMSAPALEKLLEEN